MEQVRKWGLQQLLIPLLIALFAIAALIGGSELASRHQFDEPTNVLFEADCSRVIENSTDLGGEQGRARLHPLHISVIAPIGSLLARVFNPTLATLLITVLFGIGLLYNVERILAEQLELDTLDRALVITLLGASASQVTFTMVPDTHMLSAFALSGMARTLSPRRMEQLRLNAGSLTGWFKAGGAVPLAWGALAVGMLATNLIMVAVLNYLQNPNRRFWSRAWQCALWTTLTFVVVFSLHLAQRKIWPPGPAKVHPHMEQVDAARAARATAAPVPVVAGPHANAFSPPPPADVPPADLSVAHPIPYIKWVWVTNSRFMTQPDQWPRRVIELVPEFLGTAFFAPRFGLTPKPHAEILGVTFEPADIDFRWPGFAGLSLGLLVCIRLLVATRGQLEPSARPLSLFCLAIVGFYLFLVSWYGDEAFLYSPNWAFALVLMAAGLYASGLNATPKLRRPLRVTLVGIAVLMLVNSALHVRDLLAYLSSAPLV